jgi:hypothetical protein|tara:strand:+ start:410 stop:736 length:327 start_codon:yes stop_codon:yes gene_type:complete
MAFKLKIPYDLKLMNVTVTHIEDDANVFGRTTSSGNITLNKNIPADHVSPVTAHELGHVDDVKSGKLSWDDKFFYWNGQKYLKSKWQGKKNAPWESNANGEAGTNYGT